MCLFIFNVGLEEKLIYVLYLYIFICSKCGFRFFLEVVEKLKNRYVLMRNGVGEYEREIGKKIIIFIIVRYVYIFIIVFCRLNYM